MQTSPIVGLNLAHRNYHFGIVEILVIAEPVCFNQILLFGRPLVEAWCDTASAYNILLVGKSMNSYTVIGFYAVVVCDVTIGRPSTNGPVINADMSLAVEMSG